MKRRKTVRVPSDDAGVVKRTVRVFAAWVSRGGNDEPDLPVGCLHVANDEHGRPLYGYVGPRNPRMWFRDVEDMRDRWGD
jgi:hypothetical protein